MRLLGSLVVALAVCSGAFTQTNAAQADSHAGRRAINRVTPVYPALARRMHAGGVVKLEVVIRANGSVKSTKVLGGSPVLIQAATDAIRKWRFEAAPEDSTEVIELTFEPR
jgi:TonB family protein